MSRIPHRTVARLFWLIATLHLLAIGLAYEQWVTLTKPLLMPVLLWYFLLRAQRQTASSRLWVSAALLLSLAGDCFLLVLKLRPEAEMYFLFGLGSFLLAHLAYILRFRQLPGRLLIRQPFWIIPVALYLGGLLWFLWPAIPVPFRTPVAVYGTVISLMLLAAIHYGRGLNAVHFRQVVQGAGLFVLSDSMIALSRFHLKEDLSIWIMLTYILAQWLLVRGLSGQLADKKSE